MLPRFFNASIYAVIFATGLSGLIYQVTWQKYLSRLLGCDSIATAIILATFLGGLSAGYFLCGRWTVNVRDHFKGYALLEGAIGVWCLQFPWFFERVEAATRTWSFSPPFLMVLQGLGCCALLIGVPTLCMGGTVPFLTRGLARNLGEATGVHARVYAINTAGAFVGTLLAGFWLIPAFGLPLTVMGTSSLNLFACLYFYGLSAAAHRSKSDHPDGFDPRPDPSARVSTEPPSWTHRPSMLYLIAFLSGFYVMTLENVLIRVTNLSLGSSSYSFSLIVAAFILAIAIGSHLVGLRVSLSSRSLFLNQIAIATLLLCIFVTLDTWPYWAHLIRIAFQSNPAGFWGYYAAAFLALLSVLILPVALMGATVPIAFHEIKRDLPLVGRHSGLLFSCNTIGNLTGSLIGGIALYTLMGNRGVFLTALVLAAISAVLAARPLGGGHRLAGYGLVACSLLLGLVPKAFDPFRFAIGSFRERAPMSASFAGPAQFFQDLHTSWEIPFYKDGPSNSVAVIETRSEGPRALSLMVNGKSDSSTLTDIQTIRLSAHIPALLASRCQRALVIGLGTGVTAGELTLYPEIQHIDIAEISPTVIETLPLFAPFTHNLHADARVKIHLGDAFRVMGRSQSRWDLILSEPSNVWVSGVDLLFTTRFYELARDHLTEGGMLLQWVQIYDSSPQIVGMMIRSAMEVFPAIRVFIANGGDLLIAATMQELGPPALQRAQQQLASHPHVRASLQELGIQSLDDLLVREVWSSRYVADQLRHHAVQTLDNPRLHYLAGKHFFFGSRVTLDDLITPGTARYQSSYLLRLRHPQWSVTGMDDTLRRSLIASLQHPTLRHKLGRTVEALQLEPAAQALRQGLGVTSEEPDTQRRLAALSLIMHGARDDSPWRVLQLEQAGYRARVEPLLLELERSRNWIVNYPIDGVLGLLEQGAVHGSDAQEKNWCLLQLARLANTEGAPAESILAHLKRMGRDDAGRIILASQDHDVFTQVRQMLKAPQP